MDKHDHMIDCPTITELEMGQQIQSLRSQLAAKEAENARLKVIEKAARDWVLTGKWAAFRAMEDALGVRWEEKINE